MAPKTQRQIAVRRAAAARHAALNRLPGRAGHCLRDEQVLRFVRQVRISCAIISDGPETSDAIFCFTQALVCLRWFLPVLRKYIIFEFLASSLEYRHASRAGALKIPMVHREVAEDRKEHRHVSLGEMNQIKRRVLVIVQRMVNKGKGKKSYVCSLFASAYRSSMARLAPPLLRKLPHQARRRLTCTALAGTDVSTHGR